jgi:hypothetical protein
VGGQEHVRERMWARVSRIMPVVFIHYPYSNPHPSQVGRVWVENNYPLKKWGG